jgi:hypothetical protein
MTIKPELLAAYREAEYAVLESGVAHALVLRIGELNAALDTLLESHGAQSAAFITAANPYSEIRPEAENLAGQGELQRAMREAGYACFRGEGRDPRGAWTSEPSCLVVGIDRAHAEEAGRRFAQNAIVFIERGRAPELVVLA